jgi:hypothetical protein
MVDDQASLRLLSLDTEVQNELVERLNSVAIKHEVPARRLSPLRHRRGVPSGAELIVALGSAGVFTAVWQIVREIVKRHSSREVIISIGQVSITVKGHTHQEEEKLLEDFYRQTVCSLPPTPAKKTKG